MLCLIHYVVIGQQSLEIRPKRKYNEIHAQSEQKTESEKLAELAEQQKRASAATEFKPYDQQDLLSSKNHQ